MLSHKFTVLRWICFFLLLASLPASAVQAQNASRVRITTPSVERFPEVSLFASVVDAQGHHIPGLDADDIQILEDRTPIPNLQVQETIGGTRQVFAINSVRGLRGRDALGLTRFDYVRAALLEWWSQPQAADVGADDLTLLTADGALPTHSSMAAELAAALSSYEPSYTEEPVGADLIMRALDYAADPVPHPAMTRHLIFITPILRGSDELPLSNAIAKAKETGTVIHPILVGPEEIMQLPEVANMQLLAQETGGTFVYFNAEGLSSLSERILSQRSAYQLSYRSRANRSGVHSIQAQIDQGIRSPERRFSIQVTAPDVAFIQPPDQITRRAEDPATPLEKLPPTSMTMRALITFPDGQPRQIVRSQWLVDGRVAQVQRQPPYDVFEWDLSQFLSTGTHTLQIVVEDELGLQAESMTLAVRVIVDLPPRGIEALQPSWETVGIALAILSGSVVVTILLVTLVRRRRAAQADPQTKAQRRSARRRRAGLRALANEDKLEAYLQPFDSDQERIPLVGTDLILGSDPALTPNPIMDASVNGLHARLVRLASGDYQLRDQDSIAGTWINYQPITSAGQTVMHGDVIHIGRVAFRFLRAHPPQRAKIQIQPLAQIMHSAEDKEDQRSTEA